MREKSWGLPLNAGYNMIPCCLEYHCLRIFVIKQVTMATKALYGSGQRLR